MIKVFPLLFVLFLVGCAGAPEPKVTKAVKAIDVTSVKKDQKNSSKWTKVSLSKHFKKWDKVKYRFGGLSKKGVDCSGFVYLAFLKQFDIQLPRNTALQVKLGKSISKKELKTGDLVFFRTGRNRRHVGIYLNDNKFIHASSSKGVTTSSLKNKYWSQKYWTSKRLNFSKLKRRS